MHYAAWKSVADELGVPFDRQVNNRLRGVSRMACMEIILEHGGIMLPEEEKVAVATRKNERFRALLMTLTPSFVDDSVRKTLEKLRTQGRKLSVGSSSRNAKLILERTDLMKYFDAVSDGTNISRSKPDPEVFLKAAEFLSLDPSECAVVEDAIAGIDAANAGGFLSVGIGDAAGYEKTNVRITDLSELPNLV